MGDFEDFLNADSDEEEAMTEARKVAVPAGSSIQSSLNGSEPPSYTSRGSSDPYDFNIVQRDFTLGNSHSKVYARRAMLGNIGEEKIESVKASEEAPRVPIEDRTKRILNEYAVLGEAGGKDCQTECILRREENELEECGGESLGGWGSETSAHDGVDGPVLNRKLRIADDRECVSTAPLGVSPPDELSGPLQLDNTVVDSRSIGLIVSHDSREHYERGDLAGTGMVRLGSVQGSTTADVPKQLFGGNRFGSFVEWFSKPDESVLERSDDQSCREEISVVGAVDGMESHDGGDASQDNGYEDDFDSPEGEVACVEETERSISDDIGSATTQKPVQLFFPTAEQQGEDLKNERTVDSEDERVNESHGSLQSGGERTNLGHEGNKDRVLNGLNEDRVEPAITRIGIQFDCERQREGGSHHMPTSLGPAPPPPPASPSLNEVSSCGDSRSWHQDIVYLTPPPSSPPTRSRGVHREAGDSKPPPPPPMSPESVGVRHCGVSAAQGGENGQQALHALDLIMNGHGSHSSKSFTPGSSGGDIKPALRPLRFDVPSVPPPRPDAVWGLYPVSCDRGFKSWRDQTRRDRGEGGGNRMRGHKKRTSYVVRPIEMPSSEVYSTTQLEGGFVDPRISGIGSKPSESGSHGVRSKENGQDFVAHNSSPQGDISILDREMGMTQLGKLTGGQERCTAGIEGQESCTAGIGATFDNSTEFRLLATITRLSQVQSERDCAVAEAHSLRNQLKKEKEIGRWMGTQGGVGAFVVDASNSVAVTSIEREMQVQETMMIGYQRENERLVDELWQARTSSDADKRGLQVERFSRLGNILRRKAPGHLDSTDEAVKVVEVTEAGDDNVIGSKPGEVTRLEKLLKEIEAHGTYKGGQFFFSGKGGGGNRQPTDVSRVTAICETQFSLLESMKDSSCSPSHSAPREPDNDEGLMLGLEAGSAAYLSSHASTLVPSLRQRVASLHRELDHVRAFYLRKLKECESKYEAQIRVFKRGAMAKLGTRRDGKQHFEDLLQERKLVSELRATVRRLQRRLECGKNGRPPCDNITPNKSDMEDKNEVFQLRRQLETSERARKTLMMALKVGTCGRIGMAQADRAEGDQTKGREGADRVAPVKELVTETSQGPRTASCNIERNAGSDHARVAAQLQFLLERQLGRTEGGIGTKAEGRDLVRAKGRLSSPTDVQCDKLISMEIRHEVREQELDELAESANRRTAVELAAVRCQYEMELCDKVKQIRRFQVELAQLVGAARSLILSNRD